MTAPIGHPPLDALPPDAPATVEDVRVSRRWTWVALAWAIAASAIAVIALVSNTGDNSKPAQATPDLTPRIDKLEQQTNARLDAFSRRLSDRAAASDVQKLDKRLTKAEDDAAQAKADASKQADTITQLQQDVKDLQQRVDQLESQQQSQGTATTP